eukprot:scaffold92284_cov56-Prasinocladus_malaysianus.AAC.1
MNRRINIEFSGKLLCCCNEQRAKFESELEMEDKAVIRGKEVCFNLRFAGPEVLSQMTLARRFIKP